MGNKHAPGNKVIDTLSELEQVVKVLEREKAVAVDLESDSMYHFKEKVCLIQMATKSINLLIDPLQIKDLSSLKPLFARNDIKKILHGADYDVRSLFRDFGIEIINLFDTQIASMFLGIRETGLDAMLGNRFNISLNKKYQKEDWSRRPLPEDMLEYAVGDVEYLLPLAEQLEDELHERGHHYWVVEENEILSKVRPSMPKHDPLFLKFKGAGKLESYPLATLEALLKYRVRIAEKRDKPLFKILGNVSLMKIATAMPVNMGQLEKTGALSRKQMRMHGNTIMKIVGKVLKEPGGSLPVYPRKKRTRYVPGVSKKIRALKSWRDAKAKSLAIDPALVCNNSLISEISKNGPVSIGRLKKIDRMRKWQIKEFGKDLVEVLRDVK